MTDSEKQVKFTQMVGLLIKFAEGQGIRLALRQVARPSDVIECQSCHNRFTLQEYYVLTGKSKTLKSKHLRSLATDVVLFDADWSEVKRSDDPRFVALGLYWESIGGSWGGRFGDNPATPQIEGWDGGHFEYDPKP